MAYNNCVRDLAKGKDSIQQPFLLVKSPTGNAVDITDIFVVCDGAVLTTGGKPTYLEVKGNVAKGLELLYKVFWVFNVQYPRCFELLYSFLDLLFETTAAPLATKSKKKKKQGPPNSARVLYEMLRR